MVKMSRMAQPYATSLRSLATQKATLLLALIVDRVGLPRPGVTGEPPFAALPVLDHLAPGRIPSHTSGPLPHSAALRSPWLDFAA